MIDGGKQQKKVCVCVVVFLSVVEMNWTSLLVCLKHDVMGNLDFKEDNDHISILIAIESLFPFDHQHPKLILYPISLTTKPLLPHTHTHTHNNCSPPSSTHHRTHILKLLCPDINYNNYMSWIPLIRFRVERRRWVNHTRAEEWRLHLQHLRLWAKSDLQENITRIWNKEPLWTPKLPQKSNGLTRDRCLEQLRERECQNRNQEPQHVALWCYLTDEVEEEFWVLWVCWKWNWFGEVLTS